VSNQSINQPIIHAAGDALYVSLNKKLSCCCDSRSYCMQHYSSSTIG